jgi:hypothetical protein
VIILPGSVTTLLIWASCLSRDGNKRQGLGSSCVLSALSLLCKQSCNVIGENAGTRVHQTISGITLNYKYKYNYCRTVCSNRHLNYHPIPPPTDLLSFWLGQILIDYMLRQIPKLNVWDIMLILELGANWGVNYPLVRSSKQLPSWLSPMPDKQSQLPAWSGIIIVFIIGGFIFNF